MHRCRKLTSSKRWYDVDNHIRPLDNVGLLTFALQRLVIDVVYTSKRVESLRLRRCIDGETPRCHDVNVQRNRRFIHVETRCCLNFEITSTNKCDTCTLVTAFSPMLCMYIILCYAMLCYAMLCYAMLCYAMLCYAMLCYAMLCYTILYYIILYYIILYYIILMYVCMYVCMYARTRARTHVRTCVCMHACI